MRSYEQAQCPGCKDTVRRLKSNAHRWWLCTACEFELSEAKHRRAMIAAQGKARVIRARRAAKKEGGVIAAQGKARVRAAKKEAKR